MKSFSHPVYARRIMLRLCNYFSVIFWITVCGWFLVYLWHCFAVINVNYLIIFWNASNYVSCFILVHVSESTLYNRSNISLKLFVKLLLCWVKCYSRVLLYVMINGRHNVRQQKKTEGQRSNDVFYDAF